MTLERLRPHERRGTAPVEIQINPELAVVDLGETRRTVTIDGLSVQIDGCGLPGSHPREIELIDVGDEFHARIRESLPLGAGPGHGSPRP